MALYNRDMKITCITLPKIGSTSILRVLGKYGFIKLKSLPKVIEKEKNKRSVQFFLYYIFIS